MVLISLNKTEVKTVLAILRLSYMDTNNRDTNAIIKSISEQTDTQ